MTQLAKTSTPGIYRAHGNQCKGGERCACPYVITWRHRGRQHKETCRTFNEAREKKALRDSVDSKPIDRIRFGEYFEQWIETYAGRTQRGFSETTRPEYRRTIQNHAMPRWEKWKLSEIEPRDVRELLMAMRNDGLSTSMIRKTRASLSTLFATALEDGLISSNPIRGVRIPAPLVDTVPAEERAKALTKAELATLLSAIPEDWHLLFEFMVHTGMRISEVIGLTWEHLQLEGKRRQGPRAGLPRQAQAAQERRGTSRHPSGAADGRETARASGCELLGSSGAGLHLRRRHRADPGQGRRPGPKSGTKASWDALGQLPQLPPHLCLAAICQRQEPQTDPDLAGPRGSRLHAPHLHPPLGRWRRQRRLPRRRG